MRQLHSCFVLTVCCGVVPASVQSVSSSTLSAMLSPRRASSLAVSSMHDPRHPHRPLAAISGVEGDVEGALSVVCHLWTCACYELGYHTTKNPELTLIVKITLQNLPTVSKEKRSRPEPAPAFGPRRAALPAVWPPETISQGWFRTPPPGQGDVNMLCM